MSIFDRIAAWCSPEKKAEGPTDDFASEIQLNAFEYRNYRTRLEPMQQKIVERIVNQWCVMLVKGKTMKVNNFDEKVTLDKDLLTLEYASEYYPLRAIRKMEMFKDNEDQTLESPWGLDLTFEGKMGESNLIFSFKHERHRLNFALTLRILRTRDPTLDVTQNLTMIGKDPEEEEEDEEEYTFNKIASTPHYNVDTGLPVVFSVSDMKIYQKLQSSSRHVYLEFFVQYPRQDQFLYAKSPTTHIPSQVLLSDDAALRKKKERRQDQDAEEEEKRDEKKRELLGEDIPISAMRFELKNVKLKIPRVPHTIFGRLMAKDDYFPTAVGTFEYQVTRAHLQDRRTVKPEQSMRKSRASVQGVDDGSRKEPEKLQIPVMSSWKVPASKDGKEEGHLKVGLLTIRLLGYVFDVHPERQHNRRPNAHEEAGEDEGGQEEGAEEGDEDEEEAEGDD